jgi:hypothetical protein
VVRYLRRVAQTVILSHDTVRALIEAHASMAAWYYAMSDALRQAGAGVHPPSDEQRRAFVAAMAQHFPELAHTIQSIGEPRPYVPPPVMPAISNVTENEGVSIPEPPQDHIAAPQMIRSQAPEAAPPPPQPPQPEAPPASDFPAPPAIVDPNKVKYD